jgi:hypothetical protein
MSQEPPSESSHQPIFARIAAAQQNARLGIAPDDLTITKHTPPAS